MGWINLSVVPLAIVVEVLDEETAVDICCEVRDEEDVVGS